MIEFLKIRNVKSPERRFGDAGIDCFIPNFDAEYVKRLRELNINCSVHEEDGTIELKFTNEVLIPLGIKTKFDNDTALVAMNKSGIATKMKLVAGAGVIDSSYQGEVHAHLFKQCNDTVVLHEGMKIIQFVPIKLDIANIKVESALDDETFYEGINTVRGDSGFGSTGLE